MAPADVSSFTLRLHWTLPLALSICACVFLWFAYAMQHSAMRPPETVPVDAQFVELPPPGAAQSVQRETPKPVPKQPETPPVKTPLAPVTPSAKTPAKTEPEKAVTPPESPSAKAPAANTLSAKAPAANTPSATTGARAIIHPAPVIPDELRTEAMAESAVARFRIAADGTVAVELIKPTQNPRLNRLLLETLKKWKFFPEIQEGKPVASTQDIVIKVQVQ